MNNQDMYYNPYGGFPLFNNNPQNTYASSQFNDITERISRLERQTKRLEQRLSRLETPYINNNKINTNEPDNNMYMM